MKLVFIRHADPDYPNNTLTEKGFNEIKALHKFYNRKNYDAVYCSPLNRAILTCESIDGMGKNYIVKDWLQEFSQRAIVEGKDHNSWDIPEDEVDKCIENIFNIHDYQNCSVYKDTGIKEHLESIYEEFDKVLEEHGYKRTGSYYTPVRPNDDTILFVCHLGIMSVLLSHLFNCTFLNVAEYFAPAPCSVTTLITEERKPGLAHFRAVTMGDVSHLINDNQIPSTAGREIEFTKKD